MGAETITQGGTQQDSLFSCQAQIYHSLTHEGAKRFFRLFDHGAIFLLIAGTYTPVCVIALTASWRWALLGFVWGLAVVGILFKVAFMKAPRWLTVGLYMSLGWVGLIGLPGLLNALPPAGLGWLLAGGLLYSGGAVVYGTRRLNLWPGVFGFHEVWHVFVTAASVAHFVFIAAYVAPLGLR